MGMKTTRTCDRCGGSLDGQAWFEVYIGNEGFADLTQFSQLASLPNPILLCSEAHLIAFVTEGGPEVPPLPEEPPVPDWEPEAEEVNAPPADDTIEPTVP